MFVMYKKIITPESSPVLGPMNISPSLSSREAPTTTTNNTNNNNDTAASNDAVNAVKSNDEMEPFSLYNCCCSSRMNNKFKKDLLPQHEPSGANCLDCAVTLPERKYEFGHATHYTYNATTPRLLCEFETGTPPSP